MSCHYFANPIIISTYKLAANAFKVLVDNSITRLKLTSSFFLELCKHILHVRCQILYMALFTDSVVEQTTVAFVIEKCFLQQNFDTVLIELVNNSILHSNVACPIFIQDGHLRPVKLTQQLNKPSGQLAHFNLDVGA